MTTSNPESGLVTYSYQTTGSTVCSGDVSLPCSKTDARSVKVSYSYDQLNRLVGKAYSDGTTASSCFQYATPLPTVSDPNPIGHLTLEWTQLGACPSYLQPQTTIPANAMTSSVLFNHDAMGHMQNEQQYTPASLAGGTYYSPVYGYDSAGDILSSTSGVGPTLASTFDGAGKLACVTSNWQPNSKPGSSPWSLFTAQTGGIPSCPVSVSSTPYAAFGGLQNAIYGYSGLTVNRTFDSRLRTTGDSDTGNAPSAPTAGSGTITITGAEQIQ